MSLPRSESRLKMDASIEFFVDADIINAKSVDMSKSGIKFETEQLIKVCMRINNNGEAEEHQAELVWAKKNENGQMSYGLRFVENAEANIPEHLITSFDESDAW